MNILFIILLLKERGLTLIYEEYKAVLLSQWLFCKIEDADVTNSNFAGSL